MNINIEIAVSEHISSTEKGRLLEKLGREVLEAMQYEVTEEVRITGMEVDLLAKHKISGEVIFVECKAYKDSNTLSADVFTKLLGNVLVKSVSSGWLLSTGPLGKDAKGFLEEWEQKPFDEKRKLQVYTPQRLIEVIISSGRVCSPHSIKLPNNKRFSESPCLLITNFGRFWAFPLIHTTAGVPYAVMLFDSKTGEPITNKELVDSVSNIDSSFQELEWLVEHNDTKGLSTDSLAEEAQGIVTVTAGDQWVDYRPSRPQDFVGRDELQSEVFKFLDSVRSSTSSTRLLALKAPSGWGKSSILLKLSEKSRNRRNKNKYFIYAVDVRAATSQRYGELALLECFKSAINSNFVNKPEKPLTITETINPFSNPSFIKIFEQLRNESKVIVLFFDQFEEIFAKKELAGLFESIRKLCNTVDSIQENIVLGFAWKTDGTVPADHPAYHMWHSLADRRKEYSLTPFSSKDIHKALGIFSKELGSALNPVLKRYLIDHCQGYPWLLKKLCIHVYSLVKRGIDQNEILGSGLNINDLFEKDSSELTATELACVKKIAQESPVEFFQIIDLFGDTTVQSLINKRLIIRKGQRLILYWDIFRDYILTGSVPPIPISYIPQTQITRYINALNILQKEIKISVESFSKKLGISAEAAENIVRDLVMIGNATRHGDDLTIIHDTDEESYSTVYKFMRNHVLLKSLLEDKGPNFQLTIDEFQKLFMELYGASNFSNVTLKIYTNRIIGWLNGLGLIQQMGNRLIYQPDHGSRALLKGSLINVRRLQRRRRACNFLGEAPPERVLELLFQIEKGKNHESELTLSGYRNAISVLSQLGVIFKENDKLFVQFKTNDYEGYLSKIVLEQDTIKLVVEELGNNPNATAEEIGTLVANALNKDWKEATKKRYGSALLLWSKWASEKMRNLLPQSH
jgi:hypothetical protein